MSRAFEHRIRVRYGECDPQGVVFNANWLGYFDVLITELWREAIGDYMDMVATGTDMVVAEARVRFRGPARFDDEIDFEARIERLGNTAMTTAIAGSVEGRPVVEGEMRHVFIDAETKAKTEMPADIRTRLEPYAAASGDGAPERAAAAEPADAGEPDRDEATQAGSDPARRPA